MSVGQLRAAAPDRWTPAARGSPVPEAPRRHRHRRAAAAAAGPPRLRRGPRPARGRLGGSSLLLSVVSSLATPPLVGPAHDWNREFEPGGGGGFKFTPG